jgi:Polyketide cyclase / dehydrase and lipid transport
LKNALRPRSIGAMKGCLKIVIGLIVLVLLLVGGLVLATQFFPGEFKVERSIVINAPPAAVFVKTGDLKEWKSWTAWHARDSQMVLKYSDTTTGVGAWTSWESKTEGNGKFTLTEWQQDQLVAYLLEFPDFGMKSDGRLELKPEGAGTKVTWISSGKLTRNPMQRAFGLFMDKLIGPDFETGLAKLKASVEGR